MRGGKMGRNLLFITSQDGVSDDGLSYALDLAKITRRGIAILMVFKKKLSKRFDDLMSAITFAEACEHETAREILEGSEFKDVESKRLENIQDKCRELGITVNIYTASKDIPSALSDLLRKNMSIDMVILSPAITGNGNLTVKDLKKLLKTVSLPIVTLASKAKAHSNKLAEVA